VISTCSTPLAHSGAVVAASTTAMANKVRRRSHYTAISEWAEKHLYGTNKTFLCENVIWSVYNGFSPIMPKKTSTKETVASAPVRAAKTSVVANPRVKTVKHSKAASAPVAVVEAETVSAHEQISKIAYGYWEARGFEAGSPEQDWLRAEQEFLDLRR
jgi:hypothetical protein